MFYSAYIIGDIPEIITITCKQKFEKAQCFLENLGFKVANPLINLVSEKLKLEEANKLNIKELTSSDFVYILESVSLVNVKNAELLIAIKLNKFIIHDPVLLIEEE